MKAALPFFALLFSLAFLSTAQACVEPASVCETAAPGDFPLIENGRLDDNAVLESIALRSGAALQ